MWSGVAWDAAVSSGTPESEALAAIEGTDVDVVVTALSHEDDKISMVTFTVRLLDDRFKFEELGVTCGRAVAAFIVTEKAKLPK